MAAQSLAPKNIFTYFHLSKTLVFFFSVLGTF